MFLLAWTAAMAAAAAPKSAGLDADILGMPPDPWPFMRQGPAGPETYLIPTQLKEIRRLPEPERSSSLRTIREHQNNLSFLRQTISRFFQRLNRDHLHAQPEYAMHLDEVLMAVDPEGVPDKNPLYMHEPVLQALPDYTRVTLLVPAAAISKVERRLKGLNLAARVRVAPSQAQTASGSDPAPGATRWIRDLVFVAEADGGRVAISSLAHRNYADVAHNDLAYLARAVGESQFLRLPIFFRGGNLALAQAGRKILLVGNEELAMNQQWFTEAFSFTPPHRAVPEVLKAAAGADEVIVLPNSRNLYHLDMYVVPLADGVVGLLAPMDPENLAATDRDVLLQARSALSRSGFRIVPIPTTVERMRKFQSPVNIVNFTDLRDGRRRALVPQFPEANPAGAEPGLNGKVLEAYRQAGIEPIPVEDRFHPRWGNTHCAVLPLH